MDNILRYAQTYLYGILWHKYVVSDKLIVFYSISKNIILIALGRNIPEESDNENNSKNMVQYFVYSYTEAYF